MRRETGIPPASSLRYNRGAIIRGVFRYDINYAAPTKEQRDRYMKGDCEEHLVGPDNQIMLLVYDGAVYLKDDIDGTKILFTRVKDKGKVYHEVKLLLDHHAHKEDGSWSFVTERESG